MRGQWESAGQRLQGDVSSVYNGPGIRLSMKSSTLTPKRADEETEAWGVRAELPSPLHSQRVLPARPEHCSRSLTLACDPLWPLLPHP